MTFVRLTVAVTALVAFGAALGGSAPSAHAGSTACMPGYSPCLPVRSDIDCGEISDSLKPIRVTGSDPYRLDADNDGLGCEVPGGSIQTLASPRRFLAFKSPSGNITCVMSIRRGESRFAQCELGSNGRGYSVGPSRRVSFYDGDGYDDLAAQRFVLHYGRSLRLGVFRCTSQRSAMTCRSSVSGHGFSIARERQRVF